MQVFGTRKPLIFSTPSGESAIENCLAHRLWQPTRRYLATALVADQTLAQHSTHEKSAASPRTHFVSCYQLSSYSIQQECRHRQRARGQCVNGGHFVARRWTVRPHVVRRQGIRLPNLLCVHCVVRVHQSKCIPTPVYLQRAIRLCNQIMA